MSRGWAGRLRAASRLFALAGRRAWTQWTVVAVVSSLALGTVAWRGPWLAADALVHDAIVRVATPESAPNAPVVIVAIDDASLAEVGRWPWPRDVHARLVDRLTDAGARAVGYDVLFLEAGPQDAELAAAIARNGRVFLPFLVEVPGPDGAATRTVMPTGPIAAAARGLGHVIQRPDPDGVLRRIGDYDDGQRPWPYMIDAAARGRALPPPPQGARLIERGSSLIPFGALPGGLPTVAAADVIRGRVPKALLEGRVVLVGATAAGLGDRFATPMSHDRMTMPGVEVQAHWLAARLNGREIREADRVERLAASMAPLWLMLVGFVVLTPRWNAVVGMGLMAAALVSSAALLMQAQLWVPPAATMLALALVWPIWAWRRLDAATGFMVDELAVLEAEQRPLPRRPQRAGGDPVERQIELMQAAIADVRDLKRFVEQSLGGLPDATLVTGLAGEVLLVNRAAHALMERLRPDARVADIAAWNEILRLEAKDVSAYMRAVRDLTTPPQIERTLADGTVIELRMVPFRNADGAPLGWIARAVDITALRETERQREDALRLLTHDMRAPQASILALLDRAPDVPADLADRLRRHARQTLELADGFVNLARAESVRLAMEPVDLLDVATEAADDLWALSSARAIAVDARGEEALVLGDRPLLTRMAANLISNAIKYSQGGTTVTCSVSVRGNEAVLVIADQGQGIPADALPTLFDAFTRVDAGAGEGVGLGLAFVRRVAERHGGSVAAESEVGCGSRFIVRLPKADGIA